MYLKGAQVLGDIFLGSSVYCLPSFSSLRLFLQEVLPNPSLDWVQCLPLVPDSLSLTIHMVKLPGSSSVRKDGQAPCLLFSALLQSPVDAWHGEDTRLIFVKQKGEVQTSGLWPGVGLGPLTVTYFLLAQPLRPPPKPSPHGMSPGPMISPSSSGSRSCF